jgi:NADH-quinone oxidoreductase subunit M
MAGFPLLSLITFLPLAGALLLLAGVTPKMAKIIALGVSLLTFVISLLLWKNFDASSAALQFVEKKPWFPAWGIEYHLGLDGISLWFVLLSTLLTPICILASWENITVRVREFMAAFLVLETLMIGMFAAMDMVLFYVFFEAVLIPMFLLIGVWGGENRVYAAFKFFLYTLAGSLLMLLAMLYLYRAAGTTDVTLLPTEALLPLATQKWLWLAFFAAFAVKVPMWPFHTWLPDAHVQAPTAGSVILAGVLLKMGAYGFVRFSLPILPGATEYFTPMVFALSVIGVLYTSLVALVQQDMKKLIAYSSVAHMGFVTIGLFAREPHAVQGALFQMLSHGIVSGALFLCVGVLYDRLHTKEIDKYGGVTSIMPHFGVVFLLFTMGSLGLPATSGFVGEFLVLLGTYQEHTVVATLAALGVVLGASYSLWLYRKVAFGTVDNAAVKSFPDLSLREKLVFAPLVVLTLWMGIYPAPFLKPMEASVEKLLRQQEQSLARLPLLEKGGSQQAKVQHDH